MSKVSHTLVHRFTHHYSQELFHFCWRGCRTPLRWLGAPELERAKKHGAPVTSVTGVYSF